MFINIIHFPPIKPGQDEEFNNWFIGSNTEYAKHPGFIRRILLKLHSGGNYCALWNIKVIIHL